jgi:hypothetical protein
MKREPCPFAVPFHVARFQRASSKEKPMKHYALIFYSTRTITPEEQKQRPVDIAGWVQQVTEMGIALDPRNFGEAEADFSAPGSGLSSGNGASDPPMVPIVTIVFFDSADKDQAVTIARLHPGPRYGVAVRLREWTSPRQSLAAQ